MALFALSLVTITQVAASAPAPRMATEPMIAISAGYSHACAIAASGRAWCWGANSSGQLGDGSSERRKLPVQVAGLPPVVAISAGRDHSCAVTETGEAWCWGDNWLGQLGNGSRDESAVPMKVTGLGDIAAITAGAGHSCALSFSGLAWCWGQNGKGQLGDGRTATSELPKEVVGGLGFRQLITAATGDSSCGLADGGGAFCWGRNDFGQLGLGTTKLTREPQPIVGIPTVTALSSGREHSCAVDDIGQPWCWGSGRHGQLGHGHAPDKPVLNAVKVKKLSSPRALAAGSFHSCAIDSVGKAFCWGLNEYGALGDGTTAKRLEPTAVASLTSATAISAGFRFSCAIDAIGEAYCWGYGRHGQLGHGAFPDRQTLPVKVALP